MQLLFRVAIFLGMLLAFTPLGAEDETDEAIDTSATLNEPTALPLLDLPDPPQELAELIRRGNVTFVVGGTRPSATDKFASSGTKVTQRYDQGDDRWGNRWGRRMNFDAETNFNVRLNYRSRCRWRIRWDDDVRHLVITPRFSSVSVDPAHKIWLKRPIDKTEFWESELILHEFDHVRLSSQLANDDYFAADLREHAVVDQIIDAGADVNRDIVQTIVDAKVNERFAELIDLIEIRYQELDRQTRHGTRTLRPESELFPLLRRPSISAPSTDPATTPSAQSPLGSTVPATGEGDRVRAGEDN